MASDTPDLSLDPELASVSVAGDHVEAAARGAGWRSEDVDRVVLATIEAVGNAVEHGPGAPIHVSVRIAGDRRAITVRVDDGGGGPRPSLLDTAALPAPSALGGRGLYILDALADKVRTEGGTLRMTFRQRGTV